MTELNTEIETIETTAKTIACDGGSDGHPRVWLNLGEDGKIDCPYCSRIYINPPKEAR